MAENTTVGPSGSNSPAFPVTPHQFFGHNTQAGDGGLNEHAGGDDGAFGVVSPVDPTQDFGGAGPVGANGVQPTNTHVFNPASGPVDPTQFNPANDINGEPGPVGEPGAAK